MKNVLKRLISISLMLICFSLTVSNCAVGGSGSTTSASVSSSGGGTTPSLFYTNGDGKPELTGVPTAVSSVAAGTELTVTIPVDSDTGFAFVGLYALGSTTLLNAGYVVSVVPGAAQSIIVKVGIPTNTVAATYYLMVDLATSSANYNLNNFTRYYESGTVYLKRFFTAGVSPGSYNYNVATTRVSVTAAGVITPTAVGCGTVGAPTLLTVVAIPTAYTSTTGAGGACYFILTMPAANTMYSISLDTMSANQNLYSYYNDATFVTATPSSSILAGTSPDNIMGVSSNGTNKLYIKVLDASGIGGTFRLITP